MTCDSKVDQGPPTTRGQWGACVTNLGLLLLRWQSQKTAKLLQTFLFRWQSENNWGQIWDKAAQMNTNVWPAKMDWSPSNKIKLNHRISKWWSHFKKMRHTRLSIYPKSPKRIKSETCQNGLIIIKPHCLIKWSGLSGVVPQIAQIITKHLNNWDSICDN